VAQREDPALGVEQRMRELAVEIGALEGDEKQQRAQRQQRALAKQPPARRIERGRGGCGQRAGEFGRGHGFSSGRRR